MQLFVLEFSNIFYQYMLADVPFQLLTGQVRNKIEHSCQFITTKIAATLKHYSSNFHTVSNSTLFQ